ncbi:MAG: hypothetical protein V1854_06910 [Methanobacteriota archaeon]
MNRGKDNQPQRTQSCNSSLCPLCSLWFFKPENNKKSRISCIYGSQIPLEMRQDILFGTPQLHAVNVDLGIIDPSYVNIVANSIKFFIF